VVFPNPADTHFNIKTAIPLQNLIVSVYDFQNSLIKEHKLPDPEQSVDISELTKGSYLIRVQTGGGRHISAGILI